MQRFCVKQIATTTDDIRVLEASIRVLRLKHPEEVNIVADALEKHLYDTCDEREGLVLSFTSALKQNPGQINKHLPLLRRVIDLVDLSRQGHARALGILLVLHQAMHLILRSSLLKKSFPRKLKTWM